MVSDDPVSVRDQSPVLSDARPSISTPVKQEGTAAEPIKVSVEMHVMQPSDQDGEDVSESPLTALSHMTLGTQTGRALPRQRDPSQLSSRERGEDTERHLTLDPARP